MITLKTLDKATDQEVFDQIATHLLTQKKRSELSPGGDCMYRGRHGLKCAAGCMIGDDEYRRGMEGQLWSTLIVEGHAPNDHCDVICDLQRIHDDVYPEHWTYSIRDYAEEHGFSTAKIDTLLATSNQP